MWDCIIVGAGPAGLAAALYMGRYRRKVLVVHDGQARALRIPKTHNVPGFPDGISGKELIDRMTAHAHEFGAKFAEANVAEVSMNGSQFVLRSNDGRRWHSRALILATGIVLNQVAIEHDRHEQAIADGILRYCPICDAYEHIDKAIGVIGCDSQGAAEAMFLRRYSSDITLVPNRYADLAPEDLCVLQAAGIKVVERPLASLDPHSAHMDVYLKDSHRPLSFDVVYPALGSQPRTELAEALGVHTDEKGNVAASAPFATATAGLFCAGDIVEGLDQISVAMGHGAIASTKAHNWLRECDGEAI